VKDEALALIRDVADPARKLNLLREYLQALALRSLHECEAFVPQSVKNVLFRDVFSGRLLDQGQIHVAYA
jgi:hypothetical protein